MGTWKLALKMLARDWRAGELTVLAAALLIAVSALTGVAFLTDRVGQAVEMRAAESLAADLRLASTEPIGSHYMDLAGKENLRTARIASMPSVVFAGEREERVAAFGEEGFVAGDDRLAGLESSRDEIEGGIGSPD